MAVREQYEILLDRANRSEILDELLRLDELAFSVDGESWRDRAFEMRRKWKIVSDALKMFKDTYIT